MSRPGGPLACGRPEDVAIESSGQRWTWGELAEAADALAGVLADALSGAPPGGLSEGSGDAAGEFAGGAGEAGPDSASARPRVGHVFDLRPEAIVAVHAIARAGAVLAPGHIDWDEDRCVTFDDTVGPSALLVRPGRAWPRSSSRRAVAVPGFGPVDLVVPAGPRPRRDAPDGADVMVSTSGSGGVPRVVCHSWAGLSAGAAAANRRGRADSGSVTLACLAWAHIGGLATIIRAGESGGRLVCGPRGFEPNGICTALERHGVTHLSVVPVMLERLMEKSERPPAMLEQVLVGGDGLSGSLLRRAVAAGWPVSPTYGLTEAGSQVATLRSDQVSSSVVAERGAEGLGVLDHPVDGFEIRLGPGGEIAVRGPAMMLGVLGEAPLEQGAWYPTGDIGARDSAGRLDVVGRRADRLVTGGTNVDPAEVESILRRHPRIEEVCVVGVPDERWGDLVTAVVVPAAPGAGEVGTTEELERELGLWARERLEGPRMPRRWGFTDRLPRNANGKVDRLAVRAAVERGAKT